MITVQPDSPSLLPPAETLTVEFKSDRTRLSDNELIEALVCLANTEGGDLWLGVDKIYRGMLRFGRPEPDYGRTDSNNVVLQLATVEADEVFLQLVVEQENRQNGALLPIDSLIALAVLREQKRLSMDELARHIHRNATQARRTLEQLVEAGLVQPHGNTVSVKARG